MKQLIEFIKKIINFFINLMGREVFMYLLFGGLTTVINVVIYYIGTLLGLTTAIANLIANVVAILFAYVTNRKFVFESKATTKKEIGAEFGKFVSARIATFVMDMILMVLLVDYLHYNNLICKIVVNILVIILNYIFSKIFVFKKKF